MAATGVDWAVSIGESCGWSVSCCIAFARYPARLLPLPQLTTHNPNPIGQAAQKRKIEEEREEKPTPPFPKLTLLLEKTLFPSTTTNRLLCPGTTLTPFVYASNPIMIFPCGVSSRYSVSLRRISASCDCSFASSS